MRKLAWIAATSTVVVLIAVLVAHLLGSQGAFAQGTVAFDIDPDTTGNTASTLGTVEKCVRINGTFAKDGTSDYNIDVVVTGDTQAPTAYDADVTSDNDANVDVTAAGTNPLIKTPGAMDLSDALPNTDARYHSGTFYSTGAGTAGNGTITRIGLDINSSPGSPILITFTMDPDWTAYSSAAGTHPITVDGAQLAVNQDCPPVQYTLTMAVSGSGSTTPAVGDHLYDKDTVVNVNAIPAGGWKFDNWTGGCSGTIPATTVAMSANKTCTANFSLDTHPEELAIDIRPGSYPNPINLKSNGVIPVAILTTDAFDASDVDPPKARFEGAPPVRWMFVDVDGDRDLDLLLYFRTQDTSIVAGQEEACLTFEGMTLKGCDSIKVVPAKGAGGMNGGMLALGAPLGLLGIRLGRNTLEKTRRRL